MSVLLYGIGLAALAGLLLLIPRPKRLEPGSPAQVLADSSRRTARFLLAAGVLIAAGSTAYLLVTWIR